MSLIKIKNNRGPRLQPCGTPDGIPYMLDSCEPTGTYCFVSCKSEQTVSTKDEPIFEGIHHLVDKYS